MWFRSHHHSRCHGPMGMGRGGGEGRFGSRGFGPRGGRPRMFEQGDLRYVVLKLLAEKPSHGYEIIRAVEERFGGAYAPSPGIVYPTLDASRGAGAHRRGRDGRAAQALRPHRRGARGTASAASPTSSACSPA